MLSYALTWELLITCGNTRTRFELWQYAWRDVLLDGLSSSKIVILLSLLTRKSGWSQPPRKDLLLFHDPDSITGVQTNMSRDWADQQPMHLHSKAFQSSIWTHAPLSLTTSLYPPIITSPPPSLYRQAGVAQWNGLNSYSAHLWQQTLT